ncbi:MAG TPA: hypothetical protein ENK64_03325, partial [Flavobacteriales bacterium]|nr:hypothetical protein [Flavobacteriales bacterium]
MLKKLFFLLVFLLTQVYAKAAINKSSLVTSKNSNFSSKSATIFEENIVDSYLPSSTSYCVDEDFVDFSDWTDYGTQSNNAPTHYGLAAPCRKFSSSDYMITPLVDHPLTLQFHHDSNANGKSVTIEYQIGSNAWVTLYTFTTDKNGADETVDLTNIAGVDLSLETDVRFRFNGIVTENKKWYLDDVKISCNDPNDSDAYAANSTQPTGGIIDSMNDTSAEAVDVFAMTIYDQGTSDGLNTDVTNIQIKPYVTNTADWTDNIQGFVIKNGATVISPSAINITDNNIDFSFNTGDLVVPDNGYITLTFSVYLNTSNIEDGKILSFFVDADDNGFIADNNGTQFQTTFQNGDFNSNDFIIAVSATQLIFKQQPSFVNVSQVMTPSVTVNAVDANGNIDLDFNGTVSMSSSGTMTGDPMSVIATNGEVLFDNLVHTTIGSSFTLSATSSVLGSVVSKPFDVVNQTILEPGDLAILAVNTDIDNNPGGFSNGTGDQIAFVCFKDITPGTTIYFTDNGYERKYVDKWGGTEGVLTITRTNTTLPKGTVIVLETNANTNGNITSPDDFDVWTCGNIDTNWTKTALSGTSIGGFNLNSDDDIWIMQGGTWVNDTGHQSTYDGTVLYGWTESGWDDAAPDGTTDRGTKFSNMIPHTACFTTNAPSGDGKVKFNDPNDPDFSTSTNDQLD